MLQVQSVQFQQQFTVLCKSCNKILFDLTKISDFVRAVERKNDKIHIMERYFMLAPKTSFSTIIIDPAPILKKQRPFYMLFVSSLKCVHCQVEIGMKILTISSEIPTYEILGRFLINYEKIYVFDGKANLNNQIITHFDGQWEEVRLSQNLQSLAILDIEQQNIDENKQSNQKNSEKKPLKHKKMAQENPQINALEKNLQKQPNQDKKVIKQLISTMDFFTSVLSSLQQRVNQTEIVCQVLKNKVQRVVPSFKKI